MNILIADDEKHMTTILKIYFEKEGFNVSVASEGEEALEIFYSKKIDLAVLDWMMPKLSGIDVCREIKKVSLTKVVMLTAKSSNDDEFVALDIGADEYIRKPFDPRILILRVKKMLGTEKLVKIRNLKINLQSKKVYKDEEDLVLSKKEYDLLELLYNKKGQILSRNSLLSMVWGLDYLGEERTVDTHINRLRDKIGANHVITHRGMGYSFNDKDE
ncbi:response regulator transcription factor [Peribacillus loiseleuriae]|uniref:Regulator n=1 Tax=Peribacillus loiseleuriae TaxID=1679170 RepID=A0A0K9GT23_9BACI|nr:response regulator transcription factor [Peribacillus loiseleuriae]KMY49839.1 regulator [Peribacillus loiseleuriae]